jgi:hypothetical protein
MLDNLVFGHLGLSHHVVRLWHKLKWVTVLLPVEPTHRLEKVRLVCDEVISVDFAIDLMRSKFLRNFFFSPLSPKKVRQIEVLLYFFCPYQPSPSFQDLADDGVVVTRGISVKLEGRVVVELWRVILNQIFKKRRHRDVRPFGIEIELLRHHLVEH